MQKLHYLSLTKPPQNLRSRSPFQELNHEPQTINSFVDFFPLGFESRFPEPSFAFPQYSTSNPSRWGSERANDSRSIALLYVQLEDAALEEFEQKPRGHLFSEPCSRLFLASTRRSKKKTNIYQSHFNFLYEILLLQFSVISRAFALIHGDYGYTALI